MLTKRNTRKRPATRRAATTQSQVRTIVRKELAKEADYKYCQQNAAPTSIDYSGTVVNLLSTLVRGDQAIQFDGRSIVPKHVLIRYQWNGTTASTFSTVRTMVIQWYNSSIPNAGNILASTGTAQAPLQPTLINNKNLFRVLHDQVDTLNVQIASTPTAFSGKIYIPASMLRKVYYQSSFDVIEKNALYLVVISDDGITDYPDFSYASEIKFTDG